MARREDWTSFSHEGGLCRPDTSPLPSSRRYRGLMHADYGISDAIRIVRMTRPCPPCPPLLNNYSFSLLKIRIYRLDISQ